MDITNNVNVLTNLLTAFLIVSVISAGIIIFFSRLAADNALKPIQETYNKQKVFISDASHELKTPLTIINSNIDLVLDNKEMSIQDNLKNLIYIKEESQRMSKLVNDLLYLSKMDNKNDYVYSQVNYSEILTSTILSMEVLFYEKELNLTYDIKPNIYIEANHEQLKQVIIILLDNALKYTKSGKNVFVELKTNLKETYLTVENDVEEFDVEHINKIFDRFYRLDKSRNSQTGGSGLGLAIAKKIVEENKGNIDVDYSNRKFKIIVKLAIING